VSAGVQAVDWVAVVPVLGPAVGAVAVLALDAALGRRRGARLLDVVAVVSLLVGLGGLVPLRAGQRATFCAGAATDPTCGYVVSRLTVALQLLVLLAALVTLLLVLADREPVPDGSRVGRPEQLLLVLTATAGALALAAARDYATLAVALETATLPIVGLAALRRDEAGAEAALTLLLTAVLSFGLLALGIALLYASTGSLRVGAPVSGVLDLAAVHDLGLALVVAGAAFKLSLVPFHLWTPDTYAGAPLPVAALLATVSKVAGLTALVVVLGVGAPERAGGWAPLVGALAVLTMTVGNLVALRQTSAVRLLAWSTVAQAGWVLLPLAGATSAARVAGAVTASIAYLAAYVVGSLLAFAVVAAVGRRVAEGTAHPLSAYAGTWRSHPAQALLLGFALLTLAGLPPGVMGLVAKIAVLAPVVDIRAWGLAVVAVVNVALGVAVYLRWGAWLFAPGQVDDVPPPARAPLAGRLALSLAGAAAVTLSLLPQGLIGLLAGAALR
jgi:NADH-quinone oxidoreductase subunit N